MPRPAQQIWCRCCGRVRSKGPRTASVAYWASKLAEGVLLPPEASTSKLPHAVCEVCTRALREPYVCFTPTGELARLLRTPKSRHLWNHKRITTGGLLALDPLPSGALLPYSGVLMDESQEKYLAEHQGVRYSHGWARGGVKERGARTLVLGQLAVKDPKHCGHFVNAAQGLPKTLVNCDWAWIPVDASFRERYPALVAQTGVLSGERYPAVHVARNVKPGEELMLRSYGQPYWDRMAREAAAPAGEWVHAGLRFLAPGVKRVLEALDDPKERKKRQRVSALPHV